MKQKFYFVFALLLLLAGLEKVLGGGIILSWNASTSPDVAGYEIWYGTSSGVYAYNVNAGSATSVTISNLAPGITYYFAATAYDAQGNQSLFSSEISFLVPGMLTLAPNSNPGGPTLIQFPVEPGHSYEIQATVDLQNWTSIWQSGVATSNAWTQFTDPEAGSYASRFYRLVLH